MTRARPIEPVYPLVGAGADIPLYEGPMTVGELHAAGRIWLQMTGDVEHRWCLDEKDHAALELGEATLSFAHPVYGRVELPVTVTSSRGRGEIVSATLGAAASLDRVLAHWVDVPAILPAEPLETPLASWAGRWTAVGGGWHLTLDARPDRAAVEAAAAGNPLHAVTHVASLRRDDGSRFGPAQAEDALEAWQLKLSFALGRWVPPMLAVGFANGARVSELWLALRSDEFHARYAWWDTHRGDDLRSFAQLFLDAWADPTGHDKVRYVAHHIIESNESAMTLEARIMLAGAGMEYLSWVKSVIEGSRDRLAHKKTNASVKLSELLDAAGISTDVPPELASVEKLSEAKEQLSGPEAIVWVRNRLVHPRDAGEPYRLTGLLVQAWQLLMQYSELLLLFEVGYTGSYCPRFPAGRWAHDSIPVAWATASASRTNVVSNPNTADASEVD
jgi:hypothetical protein